MTHILRNSALAVTAAFAITIVVIGVIEAPLVMLALLGATLLFGVTYNWPAVGVATWISLTAFVPHWTPIDIGLNLKPLSLIGIPVLVAIMLSRRRERTRLTWIDVTVMAASVLIAIVSVFLEYPSFLLANFLLVTLLAYVLGRLAEPDAAQRAFVGVMVLVAAWGVLEFVTGVYLFTDWFPRPGGLNEIQARGEFMRSEVAMGHSIAYGAALVLAIPYATRLPRFAGLAQMVLIAGVVVSFARGPMLALILTITLMVLFLRRSRGAWFNALLIAGAVGVGLALNGLYTGEDTAEIVSSSSNVRAIQWDQLVPLLQPLSSAGQFFVLPNGQLRVGPVTIIDSAPLRLAANFGWITAALLLVPVVYAIFAMCRYRVSSAVAVVAQIPVLVVTSLITQWEAFLFFAIGVMVNEIARRDREPILVRAGHRDSQSEQTNGPIVASRRNLP